MDKNDVRLVSENLLELVIQAIKLDNDISKVSDYTYRVGQLHLLLKLDLIDSYIYEQLCKQLVIKAIRTGLYAPDDFDFWDDDEWEVLKTVQETTMA